MLFSPLLSTALGILISAAPLCYRLKHAKEINKLMRFFVFTVNTNLSTQGNQGVLSVNASAVPNNRLMAPGPSVALQTPALPVTRPYISAINEADCSWYAKTKQNGRR